MRLLLSIFLLMLWLPGICQDTNASLSSQSTTEILGKPPSSQRSDNFNQDMIAAKVSRRDIAETSGTNTYTASVYGLGSYTNDAWAIIRFKTASTGSSTLNVNTIGAKKLYKDPTTQAGNGDVPDELVCLVAYATALDGGSGGWLMVGSGSGSGGGVWGTITGVISDQIDLQDSLSSKRFVRDRLRIFTSNHTGDLVDAERMVFMNSASANNYTIPPNGTVAFPLYTSIYLSQTGAGLTTVVAGVGVTVISSSGSLDAPGQNALMRLYKTGTNTWTLFNGIAILPIDLTASVTGVLPVPNGGTGNSSFTAGYVPYGNGSGALSSSSNFTYSGTALVLGGTAPEFKINEPSASGTNFTTWKTVAQASDITYLLPSTQGGASTVLTNNGSGTLSWTSPGGGTVTSVGLSLGTTGTDLSVSGSPVTSSGSFTLNVPTSSNTVRGVLSAADWTTFNAKQATISVSSPITLTGASVGMVNQGTATTLLHGNASGNPSFSAVSLTADVTGTLSVPNGGTGATSFTAYAPLFGGTTSTGPIQSGSLGTAGQVLTSNGAGALPTMQNSPCLTGAALTVSNGSNIYALSNSGGAPTALVNAVLQTFTPTGTAGDILYFSATNTDGRLNVLNPAFTAYWHIKAGTATAGTAPLKFTSGTNLTTAEAGAVEFDGTNLFFSPSTVRHTVIKALVGSGTIDFGSIGGQGQLTSNITVTGAADGEEVILGHTNAAAATGVVYTARVSATNTVTVTAYNITLSPVDPSSGTFKVAVIKR